MLTGIGEGKVRWDACRGGKYEQNMSGKTASTAGRGAAERAAADDFVIAVDLVGWRRLVPRSPALASDRAAI